MTDFVLDNSVAMRWHLPTAKPLDQHYAERVLSTLAEVDTLVPSLWHLEAANVLLGAEKREQTGLGEIEIFLTQLDSLPIHVDGLTAQQCFSRTISIARAYGLSSYDAAYLELAIRSGLPIATLDKDLRKAATEAKVGIYLV